MQRLVVNADLSTADRNLLIHFPRDSCTLLNHFDLNPKLQLFICCPRCCALYEDDESCPEFCAFVDPPGSPPCAEKLKRTRTVYGTEFTRPIRKFAYQEMTEWLARMLSRGHIEDALDPLLSNTHEAPKDGPWSNIFEADFIQTLVGPDGKPFMRRQGEELRLVFALAVDGFNPFGMKVAKGSGSVTGIYMALLNLPPDMHYQPENMFLVGVTPGPKKPSLEQINHFLRPLVDDMLHFWDPGVFFTRTARFQFGRHALAAIIPLVCDVLGACQVGGFLSHSATLFCSFCLLTADMIENFNISSWPVRSMDEHRRRAEQWKTAVSADERDKIAKTYGVRFSELLRLPYWDPIRYTILESMHAFFLHAIPEHVRYIWGMSPTAPSGDGHHSPLIKPPPKPSTEEMLGGARKLLKGKLDDAHATSLSKCKKHVLWYLCFEFNLRRAGTSTMLARTLVNWASILLCYLLAGHSIEVHQLQKTENRSKLVAFVESQCTKPVCSDILSL